MHPLLALLVLASIDASAADLAAPAPAPSTILGGDAVPACGWPNVVSVGGFCSGTLIHPRIVLYAAHCGDEVPWIQFTDEIDATERREVVPERCETHPIGEFGFGTDFAYCLLPAPIDDVPITPPLVGCDADAKLQVGQKVTLIGFGDSDDPDVSYGVKRFVDTEIVAFSWDEVFVGDTLHGACYGDSGGPAAVQLDDGSWRVFGVTSWGKPGCGAGNYFSLVPNGVDWIEGASGIDVTPCTDSLGAWDPSPECGGFASGDPKAASGAWDTCTFAPISGPSATCGPAFDPTPDAAPPVVTIVDPADGSHINSVGGKKVGVVVTVEASDVGWGTASVALRILDGAGVKELFALDDLAAPFVFPKLDFQSGLYTLEATGTDRAGNISAPHRIVFGVNEVPPTPSETTGAETTGDLSTGDGSSSNGSGGDESSSDGSATSGTSVDMEGGCGCRSSDPGEGGLLGLGIGLGLLTGGFARRRQRALLGLLAALPAGCSDDASTVSASSTSGESTTTESTGTTVDTTTDASTTDESTTTGEPPPLCGNGYIDGDELCDDENTVDGDGCNADCRPSGQVIWAKPLLDVDYITQMALDGAGNLIAVGSVEAATQDAWIGAFTPDGEPLWSDVILGEAGLDDFFAGVAIAEDGEIIAVGTVDAEKAVSRTLHARYAADGARLSWASVAADDTVPESASRNVIDASGATIAVIRSGADGISSIAALDDDGARLWTLALGDNVFAGGLQRSADGATFGAFRQVVDSNRSDVLAVKVSDAGGILWKKSIGDPLTQYNAYTISPAPSGDLVVCAAVIRTMASDTAILGLTAAGDLRWKVNVGLPGPGWDECRDLVVDPEGRAHFAGGGFYADSVDMWYGSVDDAGEIRYADHYFEVEGPYFDYAQAIVVLPDRTTILGGTVTIDNEGVASLVRLTP